MLFLDAVVGEWRSLVAHVHGVHGVAGSNPVSPTNKVIRVQYIDNAVDLAIP